MTKVPLQKVLSEAATGPNAHLLDTVVSCWDGRIRPLPLEDGQVELMILVMRRYLNGVECLGVIQAPGDEQTVDAASRNLQNLVAEHPGTRLHTPQPESEDFPDDFQAHSSY